MSVQPSDKWIVQARLHRNDLRRRKKDRRAGSPAERITSQQYSTPSDFEWTIFVL